MADMESENFRKLFIGGLHYETTDESLQEFYQKWGEVVDVIVMKDSMTKRSRGFGFVTFSRAHMVDDALKAKPHVIDGKQVDPKRATPKEESGGSGGGGGSRDQQQVKKVFVGGIRDVTEQSDLMDYFSQFGTVCSADIAMDKTTGRKRGFAFITFDDYDAVDKCALTSSHTINGNPCEVKKAVDRSQDGGGMRGGRGGSRGGPAQGRGGRGGSGGYSSYGGAPSAPAVGRYGSYGGSSGGGDPYAAYAANPYGAGAYGSSAGGWGGQSSGGYSDGGYGTGFGAGYGSNNGGGAMKSAGGYGAARSAGPYSAAGGYAGAQSGGYADYSNAGGYAAGGYGAYGQS